MESQPETAEHGDRGRAAWIGLAAIVVVYCVLAALQSFATRLQWGPDEPAHIIYVRSVALDGHLPALAHNVEENTYLPGASRSHQAQHPPLYYVVAGVVWRAFGGRPDQTVTYSERATGEMRHFSVPGAVRPVRLLSVVFGALTLVLVWATARVVFPERPAVWLGAAALTGFTPMYSYVNSVINNDALLSVIFAAAAWRWARAMRSGASGRDVVILGVVLGLGLNVKETAIALVAVSTVVLALEPGARSWGQRAGRMAGVVGLAAGLGGWWFLRKWAIYGSPFVYPFSFPLVALPEQQRLALLYAMPGRVFLFSFVPVEAILPHANLGLVSRFFGALAVLSAGGLVLALARRGREGMPRYEAQSLGVWLATGAVVLAGLVRNVLFVDWRMGTSGGRLLACVLPLGAMAASRGLSALFGQGLWAKVGLTVICLLLLGMNVYVIWATAAGYGTLGR